LGDKRRLSKEKNLEKLISLAGVFYRKMNNI